MAGGTSANAAWNSPWKLSANLFSTPSIRRDRHKLGVEWLRTAFCKSSVQRLKAGSTTSIHRLDGPCCSSSRIGHLRISEGVLRLNSRRETEPDEVIHSPWTVPGICSCRGPTVSGLFHQLPLKSPAIWRCATGGSSIQSARGSEVPLSSVKEVWRVLSRREVMTRGSTVAADKYGRSWLRITVWATF